MSRAYVLALAAVLASAGPAAGDIARPPQLAGATIEPHVGDRVPLGLTFGDTAGRRVKLGSLFDGKRPVLLVLTYVRCKMLCSLVLRGAIDAVRAMDLELGRDYRVISVSIDPDEEAASAAARRRDIVQKIGHGDNADWTYLIGAEHPVRALADSLGFRYTYDPHTEQFAHPAVIFVLTPDGRIARYLHGIEYPPIQVAAALRAAAKGQVFEASIPETVLGCFRFDPALRAHRDTIATYLKIGGSGVMLALMSSIGLLFLWERRRRRSP